MTDAPHLTPEQEAVRRLLADARHEGPTPPEVVARLDDALADLVSERGDASLPRDEHDETPTTRAPVVDLGARRRRLVGMGVLAAAAVVVAGVAVGQGLPRMSGGDSDSGAADVATSQERDFSDDADGGSDSSGAAEDGAESLKTPAAAPDAAYPTVSSDAADLDDELLDLRPRAGARSGAVTSSGAYDAFCVRGIGPGRRLAAEVDGRPGVILYKPRTDDAQDVAIFVCGSGVPVRTLTLPLP